MVLASPYDVPHDLFSVPEVTSGLNDAVSGLSVHLHGVIHERSVDGDLLVKCVIFAAQIRNMCVIDA